MASERDLEMVDLETALRNILEQFSPDTPVRIAVMGPDGVMELPVCEELDDCIEEAWRVLAIFDEAECEDE